MDLNVNYYSMKFWKVIHLYQLQISKGYYRFYFQCLERKTIQSLQILPPVSTPNPKINKQWLLKKSLPNPFQLISAQTSIQDLRMFLQRKGLPKLSSVSQGNQEGREYMSVLKKRRLSTKNLKPTLSSDCEQCQKDTYENFRKKHVKAEEALKER